MLAPSFFKEDMIITTVILGCPEISDIRIEIHGYREFMEGLRKKLTHETTNSREKERTY